MLCKCPLIGLSKEDRGTQHREGSDLVSRHIKCTLPIYVAVCRW